MILTLSYMFTKVIYLVISVQGNNQAPGCVHSYKGEEDNEDCSGQTH